MDFSDLMIENEIRALREKSTIRLKPDKRVSDISDQIDWKLDRIYQYPFVNFSDYRFSLSVRLVLESSMYILYMMYTKIFQK